MTVPKLREGTCLPEWLFELRKHAEPGRSRSALMRSCRSLHAADEHAREVAGNQRLVSASSFPYVSGSG